MTCSGILPHWQVSGFCVVVLLVVVVEVVVVGLLVVEVECVVVCVVVEAVVTELVGRAVTSSFKKLIGVVVGFALGLEGLRQTTLQVHPSSRSGLFLALFVDLKTIFTVSSPENFRLAVLRPQYFFWKFTPSLPPFMILK